MRYSLAALYGVSVAGSLSLVYVVGRDIAAVVIIGMAMLASFLGMGVASILAAIYPTKQRDEKSQK